VKNSSQGDHRSDALCCKTWREPEFARMLACYRSDPNPRVGGESIFKLAWRSFTG